MDPTEKSAAHSSQFNAYLLLPAQWKKAGVKIFPAFDL
jgi:hypothetical protein